MSGNRPKPYDIVARWMLGAGLVSWRYLWETTPFHRSEREGDPAEDRPPDLPPYLVDDQVQTDSDGVGALYHRRFRVRIADAETSAAELMAPVLQDFKRFVPSEVVRVRGHETAGESLREGDEMVVEIPGPWNGPVRVVHVDDTCLRLVTLRGHLEAGQVQFRSYQDGELLVFEIEAWARPSTRLVDVLYSRVRLAKEIQLNMWVRFCLAASSAAGGRRVDGVHIDTRWMAEGDESADRFEFRFARSYRAPALVFGVTPATASVLVSQEELRVRFGPWSLRTPLTNVSGCEQSGDFSFLKTAGPAHLSLKDKGVTFATNGDAAVCVDFHDPVQVLDPTGWLRHPAATLTVADPAGLLAALTARASIKEG